MNKKTIGIVFGIILAVIGFWFLTQPAEESKSEPTNHTLGTSAVGVNLTEYGDFECPACGQYHPILQQVKEMYKDRVVFQFRHFPLESLHKNARASSRAAEAAAAQGKFWEMHDYLFENQEAWKNTSDPVSLFEGYAKTIGVPDLEKFKTDYKSSEINAFINADLDAGRALGVNSTPTFVLDGKKLDEPPSSVESFIELLNKALTDKGGEPLVVPTGQESPAPTEEITPSTETPQQ